MLAHHLTQMKPTLVLHFDLNKSIIISDTGIGVNMHSMVNSIISECVWGKITTIENKYGHYWEMISTKPSHFPPSNNYNGEYVTFGEYLEKHVPSNIAYAGSDDFIITREDKKLYVQTFTDTNCIGESCRESYDLLVKSLQMETTLDSNNIRHHHIIPSFFHMIIELNQRKDINYKIIFRTFGRDINTVAEELNEFCCGNHPTNKEHHPKMDGTIDEYKDRRLHLPFFMGRIKRFNNSKQGIHFSYVCPDKKVSYLL